MAVTINPIYNQFFPLQGPVPSDWTPFQNYKAYQPITSLNPDISVTTTKTWQETAKSVVLFLLKVIILPWGLYEGCKALVRRIAMLLVCPAQVLYLKTQIEILRHRVKRDLSDPQNRDSVGREVVLEKDGIRYSGLLFGRKSTLSNGKWAIFATGNGGTAEGSFLSKVQNPYFQAGYNVLFVNGPGVCNSQGFPAVPQGLGDAQELGIRLLESAVKAKKIVIAGHSLGGAAIGRAILDHEFKEDINHLAFRMMTFGKLSHIVKKLKGSFAEKLISWFGCEMDSVAASRKLQEKGIHEVVIQGGSDELMDQVTLLEALQEEGLMANKTGIVVPGLDHTLPPDQIITREIRTWEQNLQPAPVALAV